MSHTASPDPTDVRVAALDRQVAALTARLERYDRRALLRRGGVGVFAHLTVVAPAGNGSLTAYPTPAGVPRTDGLDRPAASNLNYVRGKPALANFAVIRAG